MLYPIFVLGGFWFWTLMVLSFILLVVWVEWDGGRPWKAFFTLLATLTLLDVFGDVSIHTWVFDNPLVLLGYAGGWFAVGGLWSMVKWFFFVRDKRERLLDLQHKFKSKHEIDPGKSIPTELRGEWFKFVEKESPSRSYRAGDSRDNLLEPPRARDYKERILSWMTYWPWSMTFSLFADLVRQGANFVYNKTSKMFQAISNHAYRDFNNDLEGYREYKKSA